MWSVVWPAAEVHPPRGRGRRREPHAPEASAALRWRRHLRPANFGTPTVCSHLPTRCDSSGRRQSNLFLKKHLADGGNFRDWRAVLQEAKDLGPRLIFTSYSTNLNAESYRTVRFIGFLHIRCRFHWPAPRKWERDSPKREDQHPKRLFDSQSFSVREKWDQTMHAALIWFSLILIYIGDISVSGQSFKKKKNSCKLFHSIGRTIIYLTRFPLWILYYLNFFIIWLLLF